MNDFRKYLIKNGIATEKTAVYYQMWVTKYLDFNKSIGNDLLIDEGINKYFKWLSNNYSEWQVEQANEAIQAYFCFKTRAPQILAR